MRLRTLVVMLCVSGCRQSPPAEPDTRPEAEQEIVLELPPGPEAPRAASPGARSQPSPADELSDQSWSVSSANGRAKLWQTATRDGKTVRCTTTATALGVSDESVVWKWDTCIATREQLKFVSPDGKQVLVIDPRPLPSKARGKDVEVVTLHEHGLRVRVLTAEDLVLASGTGRYTSDGTAVELETADGRTLRLGFSGQGFPGAAGGAHVATSAPLGDLPLPKGPQVEAPQLTPPPQLLQKLQESVKKLEEAQRAREQLELD